MKTWQCLLLVCGACGTNPSGGGGGDDVIDPPIHVSAIERCVLDGGSVRELWSVGNQHGPVTAIVAGSLVVLGSQDGSVKQWSVDGDEPSYGTPFTRAGALDQFGREVAVFGGMHLPGNELSAVQVDDGKQVEEHPAHRAGQVRHIPTPDFVGRARHVGLRRPAAALAWLRARRRARGALRRRAPRGSASMARASTCRPAAHRAERA